MGNHLAKTDAGWVPALPWAKIASGWTRAKIAYRKTGVSTWTAFQTFDLTPPSPPIIQSLVVEGTRLKITITAPTNPDVKMIRVKVGKAIATNNSTDSMYESTPDGNDPAWSDWTVTPGQTRSKYYPVSGSLTNNQNYDVTAWAQDTGRNFSSPVSSSIKYTTTTGAAPAARTAYVTTVNSRSFNRVQRSYTSDDKWIRTGNPTDRIGLFYYGTKLVAQLAKAKDISRITLQIQRLNQYDYVGAARFKLFAHAQTAWSNVDLVHNGLLLAYDTVWYTLNRGQTGNFVLPGSWYDKIQSGAFKGFGLMSQTSSGDNATDVNAGTYYGYGTNSGRLYLEYTQ